MRRILAISLVILFGLPLISPLFAFGDVASNLPACCRRSGAHHCAMTMEQASARAAGTQLSAHQGSCPAYPKALSPVQRHDLSFDANTLLSAAVFSHPTKQAQTEARARVALDRSSRKRGPPAVRLS